MPVVTSQIIPTSGGNVTKGYNAAGNPSATPGLLSVGSVAKGVPQQSTWLRFEINIPDGSTINSVRVILFFLSRQGIAAGYNLPIIAGFFEPDGTWNLDGQDYADYATFTPAGAPGVFPALDGSADAAWINASTPAFDFNDTGTNTIPGLTFFDFSSQGNQGDTTTTFTSAQMLSDAQDAFDANTAERTANGVPMAFGIFPQNTAATQWALASVANATASRRPVLEIDYDPPSIFGEVSSAASVDGAVELAGLNILGELAAATTVDGTVRPFGEAIEPVAVSRRTAAIAAARRALATSVSERAGSVNVTRRDAAISTTRAGSSATLTRKPTAIDTSQSGED